MSDKNKPAFPCEWDYIGSNRKAANGMTLRQYAAIKLKVPDSGVDWLDDMIRKSNADYFAAKAMQGLLASSTRGSIEEFAKRSFEVSDAMMKAREK